MAKRKATTSVDLIRVLLQFGADRGFNPDQLRVRAGLPVDFHTDPETRIPIERFHVLWEALEQGTGDPDFGLHFAETVRAYPTGSLVVAVLMNAPTAGSAMEKLARYHDLTTDVVQFYLEREASAAMYGWHSPVGELATGRHYSEAVLAMLAFSFRALTGGRLRVREVWFRHARPPDVSEHERLFACRLVFDQSRDALVFPDAELNLPVSFANAAVLEGVERMAERLLRRLDAPDTWTDKVAGRISAMLVRGEKPCIANVAQELAISVRHLQNQLQREGMTYRLLLERLRKEAALTYLEDSGVPICDVAFLLGFADQSVFNHAFKRWTGISPGVYRRAMPTAHD